jgi:hypothetical protein
MFSHPFYNVVHIVGIILVMSALGGAALHAMTGGGQTAGPARRLVAALPPSGARAVAHPRTPGARRARDVHGHLQAGLTWVAAPRPANARRTRGEPPTRTERLSGGARRSPRLDSPRYPRDIRRYTP